FVPRPDVPLRHPVDVYGLWCALWRSLPAAVVPATTARALGLRCRPDHVSSGNWNDLDGAGVQPALPVPWPATHAGDRARGFVSDVGAVPARRSEYESLVHTRDHVPAGCRDELRVGGFAKRHV